MILGSNWKIADDGWPVLALAGSVTIFVTIIFLPLGCFLLGLMFWLAHVLHVPNRQTKLDDQSIYSPCDGVILEIEKVMFPDSFAHNAPQPAQRITIQTRLYDIQLQTSPITGHIVDNYLSPGLFAEWGNTPATWQAARLTNERREIRLRDRFDRDVMLVQLGSKTARQLICRLAEGKFLQAGNSIGLARIAGVVDLYLPAQCKIFVTIGQHTIAGETTVAQFSPQFVPKRMPIAKQPPSQGKE